MSFVEIPFSHARQHNPVSNWRNLRGRKEEILAALSFLHLSHKHLLTKLSNANAAAKLIMVGTMPNFPACRIRKGGIMKEIIFKIKCFK